MYTRQEILENRQTVIKFLKGKGRKKAWGYLDTGNGERCCLGHMCYALKIPKTFAENSELWVYDGSDDYAPLSMMNKVGLYDSIGRTGSGARLTKEMEFYNSLSTLNDESDWTTQQIGAYLETVIEGGDDTPWKPLSYYPSMQVIDDND